MQLQFPHDIKCIQEIISRPFSPYPYLLYPGGGNKKKCGKNEIINPFTSRILKLSGSTAKKIIEKYKNREISLSETDLKKLKRLKII